MNFAVILVCALVAMQINQANSTSPNENTLSIITSITTVLDQITTLINSVASQLPSIIAKVKDSIQDIVSQLPQLVVTVQEELQEVVQETKKCMQQHTFDPPALGRCLMQHVQPLVPALQELGEEMLSAFMVVKEEAKGAMAEALEGAAEGEIDAKYTAV